MRAESPGEAAGRVPCEIMRAVGPGETGSDARAETGRGGLVNQVLGSCVDIEAMITRMLACALLIALVTFTCAAPAGAKSRASREPQLVFGVYPGGAAGTVGPNGVVKPEDPALRLAALERLRAPGRPFVLRVYALYTGAGGWSAEHQVGQELETYGQAGFQTELVLCYRPAGGGSAADVSGFVGFVDYAVQSLGPLPGFTSLQVTNEANQGGSPNTSDGFYAGAADALIAGVLAAKGQIRREGVKRIAVGFNWANANDPAEGSFWRYLGRHGGRRFVKALDWVGADVFPGTWGPQLGRGGIASGTAAFMDTALRRLRSTYMPLAGIPHAVPLRVTENGYPTGHARSEATQVAVMKASIQGVYRTRRTYNVTGYRWFDLRDAESSSPSFESQYGLMRDDYSPKPAFEVYRGLVAQFSR